MLTHPLARPAMPLFIIPDLRGRADLLETALDGVDNIVEYSGFAAAHLVLLGNYIGDGPDFKAIIDILRHRQTAVLQETALCGTRERELLDMLRGGALDTFPQWLDHGGANVFASFGIGLSRAEMTADPAGALARLRGALGAEHMAWLERLPSSVEVGNVRLLHAGYLPSWLRSVIGTPAGAPEASREWIIVHSPSASDRVEVAEGRIGLGSASPHAIPVMMMLPDGTYDVTLYDHGLSAAAVEDQFALQPG